MLIRKYDSKLQLLQNFYGKLADFITWYKRSKSGASIIKMALDGALKTAGRKPSAIKDGIAKDRLQLRLWTFLEDHNDQLEQSSN